MTRPGPGAPAAAPAAAPAESAGEVESIAGPG